MRIRGQNFVVKDETHGGSIHSTPHYYPKYEIKSIELFCQNETHGGSSYTTFQAHYYPKYEIQAIVFFLVKDPIRWNLRWIQPWQRCQESRQSGPTALRKRVRNRKIKFLKEMFNF